MRFLFVYQDYATQAQGLLDDLGVRDVTLIMVRKNAISPTPDELKLLTAYQGAEAAACDIHRNYRKTASAYVKFRCEPKKFRLEDRQLREWLVPTTQTAIVYERPSDAFRAAAARSPTLVLHPDSLGRADEVAKHRWRFATLGAELLARYARGDKLGPTRNWKAEYGVDFAGNGRVAYKYWGKYKAEAFRGRTEWHLKEGDKTTPAGAARIYFEYIELALGPCILVFYVGPHPEDGEYTAPFEAT